MIDLRSQYIIYKEQENERMHLIERKLAAQENGGFMQTELPWYFAAGQWLKENVFSRRPANRQPRAAENPCQGEAAGC